MITAQGASPSQSERYTVEIKRSTEDLTSSVMWIESFVPTTCQLVLKYFLLNFNYIFISNVIILLFSFHINFAYLIPFLRLSLDDSSAATISKSDLSLGEGPVSTNIVKVG